MRLFDGLSGLVEQATLNFEAVTRPALCSNHTWLYDWPVVASSTASALSAVIFSLSKASKDFSCSSWKSSFRYSALYCSVRGFGKDLKSSDTNAAL